MNHPNEDKTMTTIASSSSTTAGHDDRDYTPFLAAVRGRFAAAAGEHGRLFTTDADGLFAAYLDGLPDRQYYNCHACRRFIETYGGLVFIDDSGQTVPAFWGEPDDTPAYFRASVAALARAVRRASVTGVFLSGTPVWGTPVTGPWTHLSVTPTPATVFTHPILTPAQAAAEKGQDYQNVRRALHEFPAAAVAEAVRVLDSEALYRSEKVSGAVRWLGGVHKAAEGRDKRARENLLWKAVASAPPGFCHPRASMAGTLLEDLAAGMDFDDVSRRFAAKMRPDQYQRPQAAPSAGNIAQAEKVVETLGIARSLARRFARLEEIETLWKPAEKAPDVDGGGVFSHLKPKGESQARQVVLPASTMTWEKFARSVLPGAESVEFYVPQGNGNFVAFLTAVHPDAPPILQWDSDGRRNPVSWYVYTTGSPAHQWGLRAGQFCKVNAVAENPAHWGGAAGEHHARAVVFVLDGARDTQAGGIAMFPEILKSELRGVRATIEAYSRGAELDGREQATACGIAFTKGGNWSSLFRVHSGGSHQDYKLDRWD